MPQVVLGGPSQLLALQQQRQNLLAQQAAQEAQRRQASDAMWYDALSQTGQAFGSAISRAAELQYTDKREAARQAQYWSNRQQEARDRAAFELGAPDWATLEQERGDTPWEQYLPQRRAKMAIAQQRATAPFEFAQQRQSDVSQQLQQTQAQLDRMSALGMAPPEPSITERLAYAANERLRDVGVKIGFLNNYAEGAPGLAARKLNELRQAFTEIATSADIEPSQKVKMLDDLEGQLHGLWPALQPKRPMDYNQLKAAGRVVEGPIPGLFFTTNKDGEARPNWAPDAVLYGMEDIGSVQQRFPGIKFDAPNSPLGTLPDGTRVIYQQGKFTPLSRPRPEDRPFNPLDEQEIVESAAKLSQGGMMGTDEALDTAVQMRLGAAQRTQNIRNLSTQQQAAAAANAQGEMQRYSDTIAQYQARFDFDSMARVTAANAAIQALRAGASKELADTVYESARITSFYDLKRNAGQPLTEAQRNEYNEANTALMALQLGAMQPVGAAPATPQPTSQPAGPRDGEIRERDGVKYRYDAERRGWVKQP